MAIHDDGTPWTSLKSSGAKKSTSCVRAQSAPTHQTHRQSAVERGIGNRLRLHIRAAQGNTYTRGESIELLKTGRTAGGKAFAEAQMIGNLGEVYEMCVERATSILAEPLARIRLIHRRLMRGMLLDDRLGLPQNHDLFASSASVLRMPSWLGTGVHEERDLPFTPGACKITPGERWTVTALKTGETVYFGIGPIESSGRRPQLLQPRRVEVNRLEQAHSRSAAPLLLDELPSPPVGRARHTADSRCNV
jgi:hypothetical protein